MIIERLISKWQWLTRERLERKYSRPSAFIRSNSLLIIKPDSIGDYILFRNFLASIKSSTRFKNYTITLLGNSWYKDIAETYDKGAIDHFIWVTLEDLRSKDSFFSVVKGLHQQGFETAFCPNYSMTVEDLKLLALCGAKNKIGHAGDQLNLSEFEFRKYERFVQTWIGKGIRTDFEFFRYRDFFAKVLNTEQLPTVSKLPIEVKAQKKVIICPGANSELRRWDTDHFAALICELDRNYPGREFVVVGAGSDTHRAAAIAREITSVEIKDQTGKLNLVHLINEMAGSELVVTNDTGPYHIAMALGLKVLCLSNGNNYGRFTPYPSSMQGRSITLLPATISIEENDQEALCKFQSKVSAENINQITVEQAMHACKQLMRD